MDEQLQKVLVWEVGHQATFGLLAYNDAKSHLRSPDTDSLFYAVQGILTAAGNLSKIFWPIPQSSKARGEEMRALFEMTDDSVLAPPRTFRDHFEHYDERLEKWAASSERHNVVDSSVFPPGAISGVDVGDYLRVLDPNAFVLTFRGERLELMPVVAEMDRVGHRAHELTGLGELRHRRGN